MFIYYDQSGLVTCTMICDPSMAPPGIYIEASDDTVAEPGLDRVEEGSLVKVAPDLTEAVNAERDRRLPLPFEFNGTLFDRDPTSLSRISGAGVLALGAMIDGAQPGDLRWHGGLNDFGWISYDGSIINMDAQTVFAFGQAAAERETLLVFAAKALKSMDPIPDDFADDGYWP